MNLSDVRPGDVLTYWYDDGIGGQLCYAQVIRVNRLTVTVTRENWPAPVRWTIGQFTDKVKPGEWHPWQDK